MKKKLITVLAFVLLTVTATFAQSTDVSKNVLTAFSSAFPKTTNVNWGKKDNYYKATFQMNGLFLEAFISEDGGIMGVTRNILSTELPISLQVSLNKNYSAYWISDLFECTSGNGTKYYVTIETAGEKIILESVDTSAWSLYNKTIK
jgi:hypothetical protein